MILHRALPVFLLLLLLAAPSPRAADRPLAAGYDRSQPIDISADRLEADDAARRMKFIGNVVARQGGVVIYAAEVVIGYREGGQDVETITAEGGVRIVQGERVATARKGIFYRSEGRIVLSGDARVKQGEDFVRGDEITVLLGEEKSIVQGPEGSRVNAVFHPKGEQP
jgi:lipopolysaccharide export system protein LptA